MRSNDIQREIDQLEKRLNDADEFEAIGIKSRLYELEQQRKRALAEKAKAEYVEAGWF